MEYDVHFVTSPVCDAWIAGIQDPEAAYCYGGTRMVPPTTSDIEAQEDLVRLMFEESHLKNRLINRALASGLLDDLTGALPAGFLASRVGGGRCIMRPKNPWLYAIMRHPGHPEFPPVISVIFQEIATLLNALGGRIKLTPDFGRFAGLADELAAFTPHVLGVRCAMGGCGGKASYSVTGIVSAMQCLGLADRYDRLTLIGAAGALGEGVLAFLRGLGARDLAVADIQYAAGAAQPPADLEQLPAVAGRFTDECLRRGGTLVMTTWGTELEHSNLDCIPAGTRLILAHNLALPPGEPGRELAQSLAERDIFVLPGQLLTLGGALTSRLEWFWRQHCPETDFTPQKPLAHQVVARVVAFLAGESTDLAERQGLTPYEAMWAYAEAPIPMAQQGIPVLA
jgi:hypothetical protein